MKKVPIGIQDFRSLIEGGYVYVDKTELIHRLIHDEMYYFLSRPRRFGKSLLVSTLAALFRGERDLFEGMWIADSDYKFPEHPVLHLDFSLLDVDSPEGLTSSLNRLLSRAAEQLGVKVEEYPHPSETLAALVRSLAKNQKVVLLVDEYDRPLVRHVDNVDMMEGNRQVLQDFFVALKALQADLRFVLLTGVSRFSKVSLFSGLNSLIDISLDERYATLIGLTEGEVQDQFGERIRELAGENGLDDLRRWYNGYRFARSSTAERVYNPWSVFNFLRQGLFENYWFESATPTFAIKLMRKQEFPLVNFEKGVRVGPEIEQNFDVDGLPVVALLFQTGYLTVDTYDPETRTMVLRPPNEEVKRSLLEHLLLDLYRPKEWEIKPLFLKLRSSLQEGDLDLFFETLNALLAGIPYQLQIASESYWHSLLYLCIRLLGFDVRAEVMTSRGRIDMVVTTETTVYIFEFKIDSSARKAIKQIKELDYPAQYRAEGKSILLVGANFSSKKRCIDDWHKTNG